MTEQLFILILVIFLVLSRNSELITNIIKNIFYLILVLAVLKIINPNVEKEIKAIIIGLIENGNDNFILTWLSKISKFIKKLISSSSLYNEDTNL
jgi:hypothetical protein